MESERVGSDAALAAVARMKERTAGLSRPHAWLLLWGSVLVSVYLAILLALVSHGPTPQTTAVTFGLMLPTMLTYSAVVAGARDRFASRLRVPATYSAALAVAVAGYFVLGGIGIFGGGFPWWVAVLAGVAAFLLLGAPIILYLARGRSTVIVEDPWRSHPLTSNAAVVTMGIGVYLGLTTALSSFVIPVTFVSGIGMLLLSVSSLAPAAKWSAAQAGVEWGLTQWICFAAGIGIMFALAVATVVAGEAIAPPIAVLCGVLVLAAMVTGALTPRAR